MVLEKLYDFFDRVEDFPPLFFIRRKLNWLIKLDPEGNCLGYVNVKKEGKIFLFSDHQNNRSGSQIKPLLLGDKVAYVFGNVSKQTNQLTDTEQAKRKSFYDLALACYEATKNPLVKAVLNFLDQIDSIERDEEISDNHWVAFRVNNQDPLAEKDVQEFWQERQENDAAERSDFVTECLICGKRKVIADRHTEALKDIPNGHGKGNPLISANENAFESYGLTKSYIAPVCFNCANKYGRTANYLIHREEHRLYLGDFLYIFWTKENYKLDITKVLKDPKPKEVKSYLNSFRSGSERFLNDDFYILALSANQSRTVVRDWIETTLLNVRTNIQRYFEAMRLDDGQNDHYYGIGTLALATAFKRDNINPIVIHSLTKFALEGRPLANAVLYNLVRRNQMDKMRVTRPRAALLKMYYNSQKEGGIHVQESMDHNNNNIGYLCGRLFSVIEKVQICAISGIKSTVVDRYYGTASTAPASVFGNLIRNTQHHLAKIRKNEDKKGLYFSLQRDLEDIMAQISSFPAYLSLKEQGLFALGYYQQKKFKGNKKNDKEATE